MRCFPSSERAAWARSRRRATRGSSGRSPSRSFRSTCRSRRDVRQRFEREAKTISQLSHPHICALYDVGHEGETEYLVMELLEGETLADRLAKGRASARSGAPLGHRDRRRARQGAPAGHRPSRPEARQRHADALGREAARLRPREGARRRRHASPRPPFPTQANPLTRGGHDPRNVPVHGAGAARGEGRRRADRHLRVRRRPVRDGDRARRRSRGRRRRRSSRRSCATSRGRSPQLQPTAPPALDRVVRTCLAKDPEERWQSAADLKRELRWIAESSQAGLSGASPAAKTPGRAGGSSRALAWAVAGLLLLGGIYIAGELVRRRPAPPPPIHSFLVPPEGAAFHLTGDEAAPIAISPDGASLAFGAARASSGCSPSGPARHGLAVHRGRAVSVLVAGRPIDRFLLPRKVEDDRGVRGGPSR